MLNVQYMCLINLFWNTHIASASSLKERRHLVSIGNYRLTGNTLGKGHFARVEEAIHTLLNVKVSVIKSDLLLSRCWCNIWNYRMPCSRKHKQ